MLFHQFPLPMLNIQSVNFKVLTDDNIEKQSSVCVLNSTVQNKKQGGLFDLHMGTLTEHSECLSCFNNSKKCLGHMGSLQLTHPYIIPQFEPIVKLILKQICLSPGCDNIVTEGKKCPKCNVLLPTLKEISDMQIILTHDNKKVILTPQQLKDRLNKIDLETAKKQFSINIVPSDLISNKLIISSPIIRPDKKIQTQYKNNDQLTIMLQNIVASGLQLNKMNEKEPKFNDIYNMFCQQITLMYKGEQDAAAKADGKKKSIAGEMMSKNGLVRGNMLGKKTTNIARATIVCDETNFINYVTIPQKFAMAVYIQEVIRPYNKERLQVLFNNGPDVYPGSRYLQKPDGKRYDVNNPNVRLEEGCILYRHLQDDDYVLMNRQPSLWLGSMGGHRIKVASDPNTNTLGMSVIACPPYAADFDGDAMNMLVVNNPQSSAEIQYLCDMSNRIVHLKNTSLSLTQSQDSVIGGYLITQDHIVMDQMFLIRLHNRSKQLLNMNRFGDKITGKQALSMSLPSFNYSQGCSFYKKAFEKFIKYKPTDKQLVIELGEIKEGYFDGKTSAAQQLITLINKSKTALEYMYYIQQCILNFNTYHGFTIGIDDFYISKENKHILEEKKNIMMQQGLDLLHSYARNLLIAPIDKSKQEFLIDQISQIFFDDCVKELMSQITIEDNRLKNNLYNLSITGSKGSFENIKFMLGFIGFINVDNEPLKQEFQGRMSIFFKRFDLDPRSYGVVLNSLQSGMTPFEMLYASCPGRFQLLTKVISVAKAGAMGRKLIRNLEPLIIDNLRHVRKRNAITQYLFGHDGFQIETYYPYKIPFVMNTPKETEILVIKQIESSIYENNKEAVNNYIKTLNQHLIKYKLLMIRHQKTSNFYEFSDSIKIPIVINTIISTHLQQSVPQGNFIQNNEYFQHNIDTLMKFADSLHYIYFNENMRLNNAYIPQLYKNAIFFVRLATISAFSLDKLAIFSPSQLQFVLESLKLKLRQNLSEFGTPCGITSGQCFQEQMSQSMLSSIHNIGQKKITKSFIERVSEIFTVKTHEQTVQPPTIYIPLVTNISKERANFINNQIKLIRLQQLSKNWKLSFSTYEKEKYVNELIIPENFTSWCLIVELDETVMFLNSISEFEVLNSLKQLDLHCVKVPETQIIRIYIGQTYIFSDTTQLRTIVDQILNYNIRGIKSITSTILIQKTESVLDTKTYEIKKEIRQIIVATGSNLRDILKLQTKYKREILFNQISCDNPSLILQWFGKPAAQAKTVDEMSQVVRNNDSLNVDIKHIQLIADEMSQTGILTSIESKGMKERNPNNDLLILAESKPVINMTKAALKNKVSFLETASDNAIMGQTPRLGSNYNQLVLNEQLLFKFKKSQPSISELISNFE